MITHLQMISCTPASSTSVIPFSTSYFGVVRSTTEPKNHVTALSVVMGELIVRAIMQENF